MASANELVRTSIANARFSIFSDEEKKHALSVCRINSIETLDPDGKQIHGGLYDLSMGPLEPRISCGTCNLNYIQCPGHPGHIELDVPVYYPMYFNELIRLLRTKCVYCHKFRLPEARVRHFLIRLQLLEMGDVEEAEQLFDLVNTSVVGNVNEEEKNESKAGHESDIEAKLKMYERRWALYQANQRRNPSPNTDLYVKSMQRSLIDQFMKLALATKRCDTCAAFSPPFRKDGAAKIFQKPTPLKQRKSMLNLKLRYKTALHAMNKQDQQENDSEDDIVDAQDETDSADEDEESSNNSDSDDASESGNAGTKPKNAEADKYLPPVEVEAQIKLLWQQHPEILNFMWMRAFTSGASIGSVDLKTADGSKIFFMRVVLVTPNRFRPAAKIGDSISDHPQNTHLKRILECNSKIRLIQMNVDTSSSVSTSTAAPDTEQDVVVAATTAANVAAINGSNLSKLVSLWIDLQNAVNCYMDSSKDPNPLGTQGAPIGIRQILERKEGLFRRHMMGKRVNYCCRSVISPDPYLGTNEIGIPVHFAKTLHYPTPVNDWNVKYLRTLVENGPDQYPGANQIETADGKIIKLEKLSSMERAGKAKLLLTTPGMKVYRHLVDGDALLVNRQPTLHKPGIMAHKARVLKHVREQTLRMNYANCNAYNADFDGDEMNCHFVQSELARAEAYYICNTDNQYIVPTSGNPLRGLIQDHVASAVKMTCKDTFLTKSEFQQLVYVAVTGLPGTEIVTAMENMEMPPPAIIKPRRMWTGKQVITALLTHLCRPPLPPLNLDSKTRTPPTAMGAEHNEHEVIIRDGQLLTGVLDKNAVGNVSLGLVHAVYELYGAELAGRLLNSIGRLMTYYLQDAGHTCGIEDLVLTAHSEDERSRLLNKVTSDAKAGLNNFLTDNAVDSVTASASTSAEKKLASFLHADRKNAKVKLDGAMQQVINKSASDVIKACLPNGLQTSFLRNNFSMMVMTGAKGSQVNQSQISCFLGQQALEGQRVPIMASGKSLPSFMPFDGSARAGGFVRDRFLTGVKPQEYYFHCMAGREGLVDTAVKTSRSGYLQRCLVKHLEELKVNYDMTVRDSAGKIIQFLYGEDGLDPMSAGLLGGKDNQMLFLARNNQALSHKFSLHEEFFAQGLEVDQARSYHEMVSKAKEMISKGDLLKVTKGSVLLARKKIRSEFGWERNNLSKTWHPVEVLKVREKEGSSSKKALYSITVDIKYLDHKSKDESEAIEKKVPVALKPASGGIDQVKRAPVFIFKLGLPDTAMNKLKLGSTVGACSEKMQNAITSYIENNPHGAIVSSSSGATSFSQVNSDALELLVWVKYMRSLACPGEAVGCVAAQSIGEPSTQMTLNTFHLAGHGGANVTLGIPRLREIIMTASKSLKTPTMTLPLMSDRTIESAKALARKLSRLSLYELLDHHGGIEVGEEITRDSALGAWKRKYRVRLHFQPRNKIEEVFAVVFDTIVDTVKTGFMSKLDSLIKQDQRRAGESISGKNDPLKAFRSQGGDDIPGKGRKGGSEEDGEGDNEVDEHDKKKGGGSKGKKVSFEGEDSDESDEDEEELAEEVRNNDDLGNLKLAGSGKEVIGYEDEEEGDDEDNEPKDGEDDVEGEKVDKKKKGSKSAASSSSATSSMHGEFKFSQEEGWIEMTLSYPITSRRLLMAPIAEKAAQVTMIRSTKSISNAYADTTSTSPCQVITEGVNFEAAWSLPDTLVNHNAIKSNDIYRILMTFGVEAARASIVSEISGVFAVYGIDVNPRHLSLIADFMTRDGGYTPMNRMGMMACSSPFLQMSFETTCTFLTKAAQEGLIDNHNSPSASIVLGTAPKVGTGCFDLMLPLS